MLSLSLSPSPYEMKAQADFCLATSVSAFSILCCRLHYLRVLIQTILLEAHLSFETIAEQQATSNKQQTPQVLIAIHKQLRPRRAASLLFLSLGFPPSSLLTGSIALQRYIDIHDNDVFPRRKDGLVRTRGHRAEQPRDRAG